jgi:hypothetical protein
LRLLQLDDGVDFGKRCEGRFVRGIKVEVLGTAVSIIVSDLVVLRTDILSLLW